MKAEESVTNYFSYVKNVLGVRTLQSAKIREGMASTAAIETADLLFIHIKNAGEQSVFAPETKDLLEKMVQAMRLGSKSHLVLEYEAEKNPLSLNQVLQSYTQQVSAPFVVIFTAKPGTSGVIQNLGPQKYLETFSPSYLLQNPNAKKVAWGDLQKVMKEIGVL